MDVFDWLCTEIARHIDDYGSIEPGSRELFNIINNLLGDVVLRGEDFWSLLMFIYSPSEMLAMCPDIMEPIAHSLFVEFSEV